MEYQKEQNSLSQGQFIIDTLPSYILLYLNPSKCIFFMGPCSSVTSPNCIGPLSRLPVEAPLHDTRLDHVTEFLLTGVGNEAFVLSV